MLFVYILIPILCVDVLKFGDPKDNNTQVLKIGNISDDTYEVFINAADVSFPIGQDLTVCYRWFFDQLRFTDPGVIEFHLKIYRNETDKEGVDEVLKVQTRMLPNLRDQGGLLKISQPKGFEKKYFSSSWYNNLMLDIGSGGMRNYRPQIWRSFCHLVDWDKREQAVVVNGEKIFSEPLPENADYFKDDDEDWPQAKFVKITFGPRLNQFTSGKSVGTLTDLNIYSEHIGIEKAIAITGYYIFLYIT